MKETRPKLYHYCLDKLELRKVLDYMKIPYIRASKENRDDTVAILGLHPTTLRARMHKLGIVCPETKEPD